MGAKIRVLYVYAIINDVNGKIYIGSSKNAFKRWECHRKALRNNCHSNQKLQRAWNKYGEESFSLEIVKRIIGYKNQMLWWEQHFINEMNAVKEGYNISPTAGSNLGIKFSEAARKRLSDSHKGQKAWNKGIKGVVKHGPCSEKTKQRISKANKGKKRTKEFCDFISKLQMGRKTSEKTKKKMSLAHKKRVRTPEERERRVARTKAMWTDEKKKKEICEKISKALKGRKQSEERKFINSETHKGLKHSEETKKKMSESHKRRMSPEILKKKSEDAKRSWAKRKQ